MIDGKTRIYGVFGYPIKHTLSPAMHNAGFRAHSNAALLPSEEVFHFTCAHAVVSSVA